MRFFWKRAFFASLMGGLELAPVRDLPRGAAVKQVTVTAADNGYDVLLYGIVK